MKNIMVLNITVLFALMVGLLGTGYGVDQHIKSGDTGRWTHYVACSATEDDVWTDCATGATVTLDYQDGHWTVK